MTNSQRTIKYIAIALAIVIILSMVSGVVWLCKNIFEFKFMFPYDNSKLTSEKYELDSYKDIAIDVGASNLTIKSCDKSTLEITDNIKYEIRNEELLIKDENHRYNKNSKIVLCIHNGIFDEIKISGGAGDMIISDLEANKITFELGAGKVGIDNLVALESFKLSGGAGEVKIFDASLANAIINLGVGNFTLDTVFIEDADIDMGIGNLDITLRNGIEKYKFDIEKGIGNVSIDGEKRSSGLYGDGPTIVKIDGGIGNIKIK